MNNIECKENFEMKNLTSFKIGGCVNKIFFPKSQAEFLTLIKNIESPIILGNCSNIIVSSHGCSRPIICTSKMNNIEIRGTKIIAECGVRGPLLSQKAHESKLSGFEFMIGFPGSIGGNLFMNAGAHNQSISDTLTNACLYDREKDEIVYLTNKDMEFGYRHSILQTGRYIALSAEFDLKRENPEVIKGLMDRNLEFRKNIQPPLTYPNAGSVFKNPENDSAGRLLDKAGVKDFNFSRVAVWQKHANFIINKGEATSEDVLELMLLMQRKVKSAYTIELTPEIRFIGDMNKHEEEICQELYKKIQK